MTATTSRATAPTTHRASSTDWSDRLARFGLVGKGVLHAVIGLLALELALGDTSTDEASPAGAADWIAGRPFGTAAVWVVAASLLSLAVWRAATAWRGDPAEQEGTVHRLAWAGKAVVYAGLALTFAGVAIVGGRGGSSGSDEQAQRTAGTVFDWPMGRWLVVGAGLATVGFAVFLVVRHAIDAQFAERLTCSARSLAVKLGRVGYGLRSLAYLLVGSVLISAGLSGDEKRAKGLGGALDELAAAAWGTVLLLAVAVGFLAFGAYCVAEARYRRAA